MSTYQVLKGLKIKYLSSDTSGDRIKEGEIFYNSSDFNLKSFVTTAAWHSSGSTSLARYGVAGTGTQTAGLIFGGNDGSGPNNQTEEYNGSGWVSGGALNTGRYLLAGGGVQTASVAFNGEPPPSGVNLSEEYNGSSWTEGNNLNTARRTAGGDGPQTAAICAGGTTGTVQDVCEVYDGTSWTEVADLNTEKRNTVVIGSSSAALNFGGYNGSSPNLALAEAWDGSSWTEVGDLNTARLSLGASGTSTATLGFGGYTGTAYSAATEEYDGTSWATSPASLGTARGYLAGLGSNTSALAVAGGAGSPLSYKSLTEEFTVSLTATTAAAWASGGNMNTARGGVNNASGDKAAAATFGGQTPGGRVASTEEYNGSSWTSVTNTPATRRSYLVTGTQTASLLCGGQPPTPTANGDAETFEYDGSSFSDTSDINTQRDNVAGAGTQTAGLGVGGRTRPGTSWVPMNNVEEYNGSSWTAANVLPSANASSTNAAGPQTAAIFAMANPAYAASYDGTNWTAIPATQTIPSSYGGTATTGTNSSNAFMGGGEEPGGTRWGNGQQYNGTSWITTPSFATSRNSFGATGSFPAMLIMGGQADPGYTNATEEFTVETTAARAVKTIDFD